MGADLVAIEAVRRLAGRSDRPLPEGPAEIRSDLLCACLLAVAALARDLDAAHRRISELERRPARQR